MKDLQTLARACAHEQARISEIRLAVWTSGSRSTAVCKGIDLKPLTFQAAIDLCYAGNPLLVGGDLDLQQCIFYLWRNSLQYQPGNQSALNAFISVAVDMETSRLLGVCRQHVADAFFDVPVRGSSSSDLPAVEPLVSIVEEMAARYGLSPDIVLGWSIARGYALQRAAYIRTIPDYQAPIPKTLFELRNLYASELTRQLGAIGEEEGNAE